jgi:hypothetical protein
MIETKGNLRYQRNIIAELLNQSSEVFLELNSNSSPKLLRYDQSANNERRPKYCNLPPRIFSNFSDSGLKIYFCVLKKK